jgi:hypothetical protein
MYVTIRRDFVQVIGNIWQPGVGPCAQKIELCQYDLDNIGEFTRENVEHWLYLHAGDFSSITDFYATAGHDEIQWESEENEMVYFDCMHPGDE